MSPHRKKKKANGISQTPRSATHTMLRVPTQETTLEFPVNIGRMSICPVWKDLKSLRKGEVLEIKGLDFKDPQAKRAIEIVLGLVHGDDVLVDYRGDPRLLLYMTEVHKALGSPKHTCHAEQRLEPDDSGHSSFFRGITNVIFDVGREEKYLYRVNGWLLFALVADRIDLYPVKILVRNNLVLFCRSEQQSLPDEVKDSIGDGEWEELQRLNMVDNAMLEMRKCYVDTIFKCLRLLSHQLEHFEKGGGTMLKLSDTLLLRIPPRAQGVTSLASVRQFVWGSCHRPNTRHMRDGREYLV
ncbi:uncharacterized protein FTOL_01016 [Fusarium torulosum]|uniref:Uncharacterized protein n=1 Tax=Fusarium torulosum TaxID=33205 RepID=A0AAE8LZL8_9HYPO|nr:uncharacterized protein FTOL_01016 [Fusarium torulosum]